MARALSYKNMLLRLQISDNISPENKEYFICFFKALIKKCKRSTSFDLKGADELFQEPPAIRLKGIPTIF